ncbi:MAG: hypothetical protein KJ063_21730 [Anaerolineae bacterium]|nr:hypothetical protein [Anaerolineae bacterium]
MSPRTRLILALFGLICLVVALLALVYVLGPAAAAQQRFSLPPDVFQTP